MPATLEEKQNIENDYWRDSEHESPQTGSIYNIVNKMSEAAILLDCFKRHEAMLSPNGRVLELGGGQGWAACAYKKLYPDAHVTTTDLSTFAVASLPKWENLFTINVDKAYACKSYETNEEECTLDIVFCFAAAHHFVAHKRTLLEIRRILKPGGKAIYFYEPATPRLLYPFAYRRVNRKRPEVPEDVLITSELVKLSKESGLDVDVDYYPSLIHRGPFETVYFWSLRKAPVLQRTLPCTANFIFTKNSV